MKYIEINPDGENHHIIRNKKTKEHLATIYFHKPWNKWVVDFGDYIYDAECLTDITSYLHCCSKLQGEMKKNETS